MKILNLAAVLLLSLTAATVVAQDTPITTFIVVRHAEKANDGSKDPELAPAGMQRAEKLATMLSDANVNAIYSTNFKRTRGTVKPFAAQKDIAIQTYENIKAPDINELLKKHEGQTVLICGHSNTVPAIVNLLIGKEQFKDLYDSEYGNVFVVTVAGKSRSVTRLHF